MRRKLVGWSLECGWAHWGAGERPSVNVPSPRMGKGGYDSDEFENKPAKDLPCSSLFPDVEGSENLGHDSAQGVPHFAAWGNRESPRLVLSVSSQESGRAANEMRVKKCISNLKKKAHLLDGSLPLSFGCVRDELDNLWKEVDSIKVCMSASPLEQSGSSPLFQGRYSSSTMPQSATLSPPALQILMRQVVNKLRLSEFVTCNKMGAHVSFGVDSNVTDQLSGLGKRVGAVERKFTDPNGTMAKIKSRISFLEDRHAGDSIERGGKAFHDVGAVAAWVQTFKDKDLFRYCVNMVTLLMLCANPYKTIAEGMATAAAAHKAEYNSLTEACISLSYGLTYPEYLMKKYDKEKHAAT